MTDANNITSEFVSYDKARAEDWLSEVDLDIHDEWPMGGDDDRLAGVLELLDRALADSVIELVAGAVSDVELIETRDRHAVLSGARLLVVTWSGVTLAHNNQMWASSFVDERTGREAALAALAKVASLIETVMTRYRAACGL